MRVEFELWFKDLTGSALNKFRGTTRSVFSGVDSAISKTKAGLAALASPVNLNVNTTGITNAS